MEMDPQENKLPAHLISSRRIADENSSYGSDEDESDDDDDDDALTNRSTRTLTNIREDIKIMNVTRGLFILSIITVAVISAQCVFIVTTLHESSNFQAAYEDASSHIIERFYEQVNSTLWQARGIATGISVSYRTADWPYVTIASFDSLCESVFVLSQPSIITFQPKLSEENRVSWEEYAGLFYPLTLSNDNETVSASNSTNYFVTNRTSSDGLYRFENGIALDSDSNSSAIFPIWQMYPLPENPSNATLVGTLFDETSNPARANAIDGMTDRNGSTISSFLFQDTNESDVAYYYTPRSNLYYPIFDGPDGDSVTGSINLQIAWESIFRGAFLERNESIIVVIESSCGGNFSYEIEGENAYYLGAGNMYDPKVNGKFVSNSSSYATFASLFDYHGMAPVNMDTFCSYRITSYASPAFKSYYFTSNPNVYMGIVFLSLMILAGLFIIFDFMVGKHQRKMLQATKQSDAIVRSLFPDAVADRLYEEARKKEEEKTNNVFESKNRQIRNFMKSPTMASDENSENVMGSDPIAELFPNTTVLFADFVGFTAWSSEREPVQVFVLLETVFFAMDKIAKRMNVFKVETIGDCYVAATGIPEPQEDHAERMALYAYRCLTKVKALVRKLEAQLGPGTAELSMRIGIHSGPITAGVVRGQKARFQLFGDTMNMASRIETTGVKDRIHLSRDTALLLRPHLVVKREDAVTLKGKGVQDTYWYVFHSKSEGSHSSSRDSYFNSNTTESVAEPDGLTEIGAWQGTTLSGILGKTKIDATAERLVLWNVDTLKPMLCAIIAKRAAAGISQSNLDASVVERDEVKHEVQVVIEMEKFNAEVASKVALSDVPLPREVEAELVAYVSAIASGYPKNPFHSFEHCSHVVMSASKLLKRIVASEDMKEKSNEVVTLKHLHDHTFGIATDPLCQFAIVFSALVHDVGHPGVPNTRLAIEEPLTAKKYSNRSIAEQRSLDVAFDLLNLPNFENLRKCIYMTESECIRFRQLVVNSILATDIADKDMKALRDIRWNTAFQNSPGTNQHVFKWMDRKATIVIEHVIQASDVSHTMQHFVIYQKWNERLFQELYFAFLAGRLDKDPTLGWYNGEIWFFDNYIIPLAHKLKDCGVFGVSSDEYLHYARQNRHEWELKGHSIVEEMKSRADTRFSKAGEYSSTTKTLPKTSPSEHEI